MKSPKTNKTTENNQDFLSKVKQVILENIEDSALNADFIADRLFLSRSQLYRKVQALTGYSIAIYVRNYRLKQAEKMLSNRTLSIQDIAFSSGFNNPKYFSSLFSKTYGCSPTQYRENLNMRQ